LKEASRKLTDVKDIEIVLAPGTHSENVTVTPARTDLVTGGLPTSVTVVDRTQIDSSPAVTADDILRQVPSFSLFRRTSSLSSHPTAQGVCCAASARAA
jgi:outer membrane cobalamin receptor